MPLNINLGSSRFSMFNNERDIFDRKTTKRFLLVLRDKLAISGNVSRQNR
jgi:hypothetical protein